MLDDAISSFARGVGRQGSRIAGKLIEDQLGTAKLNYRIANTCIQAYMRLAAKDVLSKAKESFDVFETANGPRPSDGKSADFLAGFKLAVQGFAQALIEAQRVDVVELHKKEIDECLKHQSSEKSCPQ